MPQAAPRRALSVEPTCHHDAVFGARRSLEPWHPHRHRREGDRHRNCRCRFGQVCEDLLDLDPYHTTPTHRSRPGALQFHSVIMEYLDERFPHPPLMRMRARARAWRSTRSNTTGTAWRRKMDAQPRSKDMPQLRKVLRDNVLASADLFKVKPFFLQRILHASTITPILWRLPRYEIDLPAAHSQVRGHHLLAARRVAAASLSENEREMRLGMNDARAIRNAPLPDSRHAQLDDGQRARRRMSSVDAEKQGVEAPCLRQGRQGGPGISRPPPPSTWCWAMTGSSSRRGSAWCITCVSR